MAGSAERVERRTWGSRCYVGRLAEDRHGRAREGREIKEGERQTNFNTLHVGCVIKEATKQHKPGRADLLDPCTHIFAYNFYTRLFLEFLGQLGSLIEQIPHQPSIGNLENRCFCILVYGS